MEQVDLWQRCTVSRFWKIIFNEINVKRVISSIPIFLVHIGIIGFLPQCVTVFNAEEDESMFEQSITLSVLMEDLTRPNGVNNTGIFEVPFEILFPRYFIILITVTGN